MQLKQRTYCLIRIKFPMKTYLLIIVFLAISAGATEQQRSGRYTLIKTAPEPAQLQPLSAMLQLTFPAHIQTVHDASVHVLFQTGYRLEMDEPSKSILARLPLPSVHRTLGPMRTLDALKTVLGPAWTFTIDDKLRVIRLQETLLQTAGRHSALTQAVQSKKIVGKMSEPVIAHYSRISVKKLVAQLIPEGWQVNYQIPLAVTGQLVVFHAETTRRKALEQLFKKLKLAATFYPGEALLLVRAAQ